MPAFFWSQGFLSIGVNYDPLRRCVKSRILTDALFAPPTSPGGADCILNPCCISFGRAVSDSSLSLRRCDNRYAVRIKQERSVHIRTQPRPQGFSLKKWVGREKPWGRGWYAHTPVRTAEIWGKYIFYFLKIFSSLNRMTDTSFAFNGVFSCVSIYFLHPLLFYQWTARNIIYGGETNERLSSVAIQQIAQPQGRWYWWRCNKALPVRAGPSCSNDGLHYPPDKSALSSGIEIYQLGLMLCGGSDSLTNFP